MGYKSDVHCQPRNVSLGKIVALFGTLNLLSGHEDGVIAFRGAVLQFNGLILELLLVLKVVKGTVGTAAHNDLLQLGGTRLLKSVKLAFAKGSCFVSFHEVFFRANVYGLVGLLQSVEVV